MSRHATDTFSIIYRHWAPRIFNHFRRLSWSVDDASDLTSEVFTVVLERLPQLQDRERVGGWLWTIANRHAANRRRSDQRRQQREGAAAEASANGTAVHPSSHRLRRALAALGDDERQMILWREYSGLSYREIADMTGRTIESVRAGLYRARVQLRDEFSKRWE